MAGAHPEKIGKKKRRAWGDGADCQSTESDTRVKRSRWEGAGRRAKKGGGAKEARWRINASARA